MMHDASTQKEHNDIAKEWGIRSEPSLHRVGSINYAICAPWEWMHLLLENVVLTLLADLMKLSIKLQLTHEELEGLRIGFIDWVDKYEKYYYQYREDRLSCCTLPIHGLLHVAQDIENCGPVWVHWTFFLERYCQLLKTSLRSRRHPWSNLARKVLHVAYLTQINIKYDLTDELFNIRAAARRSDELFQQEKEFPDFRVRSGDAIRTTFALQRLQQESRDNTFVRYEVAYHGQNERDMPINAVRYGRLEKILVCELSTQALWRDMKGCTLVIALVRPCLTRGDDASQKVVEFRDFGQPIITDLRNIKCVVGRVKSRGSWGLVDRSDGCARAVFQAPDDLYGVQSDSDGERYNDVEAESEED
ncbi:hypothetical protein BU15DRAFT_88589 [Melanogaster broomeanus]|nr:hypothetical protein BU15DRAFT_88589 [Melanogaster broomeanus]